MKIFTPLTNCRKTALASLAVLFCLIINSEIGNAQVSSYTFTQSSNTYTAISGTTAIGSTWDDNIATLAIPFTFYFNGIGYTSCSVNSNGYVTFGTTTSASTSYSAISSNTAYAGAVAGFSEDLGGTASAVTYTTSGSSPNRIFIVQWTTARRYIGSTITTGDNINFQIRLYETSNKAEIMYGTCAATSTSSFTCQVGLRGSTTTDFNDRTTTNNWSATTVGGTNAVTCTSSNIIMPASGLTFTWTPPLTYKDQFSALTNASSPWCAGETRNVSITVTNNGSATWTSGGTGVNLSYWWTPGQNRDFNPRVLPFVSLAPGASQIVTTSITAPATAGTYALNFDLVKEGSCWFGDNTTNCSGPGNSIFTSSITITASAANAGAALAAICQGGTSAGLGGSVGGTATGGTWSDGGIGGTFNPNSTTLNATYTPPAAFAGTVVLTLTTIGGACNSVSATKNLAVNQKPLSVTYSTNPAVYCAGVLIAPNTPTTVSGGAPTLYSVSPALPAGLSLNTTTGVISGTPTATTGVAAANYTVTANNSCGSTTVAVNITISPAAPTALTYTNISPAYCVGTAITNNSPSNSGGAPTLYSVSPALPAGLSLSITTGIISATPTAVTASANYTVTASNSCGSTTKVLTIAVSTTPAVTYSTNPAVYCAGQVITNNTPSNTGGAVNTYSVSPALPAGLSLNTTTGVISGTPTATNGVAAANYTVTANNSCGSTTVAVNITISPAAPTALNYSSPTSLYCVGTAIANNNPFNTGGAPSSYSVSPALPAGLSLNTSTGVISGTPTAVTASKIYTVTASNSCGSATKALTIVVTATPAITYSTNPAVYCAGQVIAANNPSNSGGAVTSYSVSPAVPAGLTFNTSTGVITGTPTATNGVTAANYTITANNSCGSTTVAVNITISPAAPTALNFTASTSVYCLGSAITNNIPSHTGGNPTLYSVSPALPAGLSVNTSTGVISGTPTTATAAANYTVTASNSCGSTTAVLNITINPIPTGTLTATETSGTTNNDNNICAGDPVTFTFSNSTYGSYIFKVNGTVKQTGTSNTYSNSTLANGDVVTVDIANANNCGATFTFPAVTVSLLPATTLTVTESSGTANDNIICPNTSVTFTAPANLGSTYSFIINGTTVSTGSSNTYSTTSIASNSTVAIMETNSNGCQFTTPTQNLIVTSVPSGALSVSPGNSFCIGTSVTFTATATAPTTGYTYNFKVNGVSKQNNSTNAYTTNALTNGQVVTVDVTNSNGCTTTFNPNAVTVNPLPTGTLTATENSGVQNDNSICTGSPVTFTATSGYSNYVFYLKGTGTALYNGPLNVYTTSTLADNDYLTVVVTSGSGCTATFTSSTITVVPSPTGTFIETDNSGTAPNDNTICAGDNATLTATAGFSNYNFQVNGTTVQNGAGNTFSSTTLADGDIITVDVTNSNSCVTTFNAIILVVNPLPTGTLAITENAGTPNDGIICTGTSVTFTAPNGFTNYNFLLNGASIQNGALKTYTTTSLANGDNITVAVTGAGGCIGLLNQYTTTVNPLPVVAPITTTAPSFDVCVGSVITLHDATSPGVWSSENTGIATVNASTGVVTGVAAGAVLIDYTFTNSNGCSTTVTATVTVHALPVVQPITGNFNVCTGTNSQLNDATTGGTWSSSDVTVATVNASGNVTSVSQGMATISYTVTDTYGCSTTVTAVVTVSDFPAVAPITTTSPSSFNVCIGGMLPLNDVTTGGTWSVVNGTGTATITTGGVITGITSGIVTVFYSINSSCGLPAFAMQNVNVNTPPSATISYAGSPFCTSSGAVTVTQTGTTGGTYSSTTGLTINTSNGIITPSASTAATYTVMYTIPATATGGCGVYMTTASVTITAAPSITSLSYSASPYCSTVTSASPSLVASSTGGTYSSTGGLTLNSSTGVINPSTSTAGTYTVTYTIAASGGCAPVSKTTSVTITATPTITSLSYNGTPYCSTVTTASPTLIASSNSGTYSYTVVSGGPTLSLNAASGVINPSTSSAGTYTVTYTIAASGNCAAVSKSTSVTITAAPTAVAGTNVLTCSNSGAVNITAGSSATNQSSVLWTTPNGTGTFANANSLTTATYTPSAADIIAGSRTLTLTANGNGSCAASSSNKTIIINAATAMPAIAASPSTICLGNSSNLVIAGGSTSALISESFNGTSTFSVANLGGNTSASAWINRTSTYTYSYGIFNSVSFNSGSKFMLANSDDGGGVTNTALVSPAVSTMGYSALTLSYRTYFRHNSSETAVVEVSTNSGASWTTVESLTSTTGAANNFSTRTLNLNSYLNNSSLILRFRYTGNNEWWWAVDDVSLTASAPLNNYSWTASPAATAGLPSGAGTPSNSNSNIVVTPTASGSVIYTATLTNAIGCTSTGNVTVAVSALPTVTISADYCISPGKVRLTANGTSGVSYLWSTGATTPYIDVNTAGSYDVTVSVGGGCPATATINVATELVTNGDFESGNTGFTSDYAFHLDVPGLVPAGQGELYDDTGNNGYSITISGQNVHEGFYGHDHGTGTGNFMAVNGHGNTLVVWKQTVNVLPNTTYYFSAWGMSMNSGSPRNAQLQFSVNGTLIGTKPALPDHGETTSSPDNWTQFYGNWTSGPTTTSAVIYINDLQASAPDNDFGLDDISFGTLSTFVSLASGPGTDAQTLCVNTPITDIVYNVGNGNPSGPTVTGLPAGVTKVYAGDQLTISGTPTVAGNYTYTIQTTGCNPQTATGTITVQAQKITLSSGSSSPSVCANVPMANIVFTLSGTAINANTTGLPAGVTGAVSGSGPTYTYTISGTPTAAAGLYPYTITTSGTCTPVMFNGTITITSQTITLNSANNTQTVCINSPIANIQYTVGGTGMGILSVSPLPAGVSYNYNSGILIISGTPTASGTFNYTITTSGTCAAVTATGTITVTPGASFTLTSGAATNPQTVCKGTAITNITYSVSNATGASATGLPTGVTGAYSGGVFTISGTPTAVPGTYNYTVTSSGGCAIGTTTGSIIVQAQTIGLTSGTASPSVCANMPMTNIVYTIGGTATGALVTGLPAGLSGTLSGNTFTISGTPTAASGPYNYTITTSGTCGAATAAGTITISAAPVGGTIASVSICSGASGSITVSGNSSSPVRWEVSTDFGTTWTPTVPNNTTITQLFNNVTTTTQYRAVISGCGIVYSQVATVGVHNLWTGRTSTDWNTVSNWSDNQLPSFASCNTVMIPAATPNAPQLTSNVTIPNITIAAGTSLDLNGKILTVTGSFSGSNTGNLKGSSTSGLIIGGTATSLFFDPVNNVLQTLTVNNGGSATLGNALNITAGNSPGIVTVTGTGTLTSNGNLTLKSDGTGTAMVGVSTGTISGAVTVERFIPYRRAWRFLGVPVNTSQTVNQAWQEGQTNPDVSTQINPNPEYGTDITYAGTNGYDPNITTNPSIKTWVNGAWFTPTSTFINLNTYSAYCLFVRGSRAVNLSQGVGATTQDNTVLRAFGTLNQTNGNLPLKTYTSTIPNDYVFIGNPYASSIDLQNIIDGTRPGVSGFDVNKFWVWDPKIGGVNNVGGYVAYTNGVQVPPNSDPSYTAGTIIQSGQAFMLQLSSASTTSSVKFQEADKNVSQAMVFGKTKKQSHPAIYTNLIAFSTHNLVDGVGTGFGEFSKAVDANDAAKQWNFDENIAQIRDEHRLAIEMRPLPVLTDTLYFKLFLRQQPYILQIFSRDLPANTLQGWLVDKYLNTKTAINLYDTTLYNFTPNTDTNSYRNRFMLVFKHTFNATPVPVTKVVNQANPGTTGSAASIAEKESGVTIYPNPVATGQKVILKFSNLIKGRYEVTVSNAAGKVLLIKTIVHDGGSNAYNLQTDARWATGSYLIQVTGENGLNYTTKLVIGK